MFAAGQPPEHLPHVCRLIAQSINQKEVCFLPENWDWKQITFTLTQAVHTHTKQTDQKGSLSVFSFLPAVSPGSFTGELTLWDSANVFTWVEQASMPSGTAEYARRKWTANLLTSALMLNHPKTHTHTHRHSPVPCWLYLLCHLKNYNVGTNIIHFCSDMSDGRPKRRFPVLCINWSFDHQLMLRPNPFWPFILILLFSDF